MGRERDAGCDCTMGMSKKDKAAIPPDASNAVDMLKICMVCVADILLGWREIEFLDIVADIKGDARNTRKRKTKSCFHIYYKRRCGNFAGAHVTRSVDSEKIMVVEMMSWWPKTSHRVSRTRRTFRSRRLLIPTLSQDR